MRSRSPHPGCSGRPGFRMLPGGTRSIRWTSAIPIARRWWSRRPGSRREHIVGVEHPARWRVDGQFPRCIDFARRRCGMGMKEMKAAYVAKMEAQVAEWGAKLKQMKAKAEKAAAQGRIEYQPKLAQVRADEKHEQARRKLDELKVAGEERWEALKSGVEGAWNELKKTVDSTKIE